MHIAAPRRVLEPAGLRVLVLRRGSVPLRAEPAPELKTALFAAAGATKETVVDDGLHTIEEHVVDRLEVVHPQGASLGG